MRKLVVVLAVVAMALSSCGSKQSKHSEGTQVHEDGTVHEAHGTETHGAEFTDQEVFEVKSACSGCEKDTCQTEEKEDHDHAHDHDHDHSHEH
jgi:hypothetical protein